MTAIHEAGCKVGTNKPGACMALLQGLQAVIRVLEATPNEDDPFSFDNLSTAPSLCREAVRRLRAKDQAKLRPALDSSYMGDEHRIATACHWVRSTADAR